MKGITLERLEVMKGRGKMVRPFKSNYEHQRPSVIHKSGMDYDVVRLSAIANKLKTKLDYTRNAIFNYLKKAVEYDEKINAHSSVTQLVFKNVNLQNEIINIDYLIMKRWPKYAHLITPVSIRGKQEMTGDRLAVVPEGPDFSTI